MPVPLTRRLGEIVAGAVDAALPPAVLARARAGILDTLGCLVAGFGEPAVCSLSAALGAEGLDGPCSLGLGVEGAQPLRAALVNGTAAHALDFDDVAFGGHIGAVVVPAALAVAEARGASGLDLLRAYVAGYEAWAEVASREGSMYHVKGLHPTGLLGPIGAAAACSVLLRLDADATARALAIAASQGAGLLANFGTPTKPFHAGRAAQSGVLAAQLAAAGHGAAADALETETGFLRAYTPRGEIDLDRAPHHDGGAWRLEAVAPSVKRYPVCYAAHRAIDAALELRARHPVPSERIASIEVTQSARHGSILRCHAPETAAEARFSVEFAVASALLHGWVGFAETAPDRLRDPALRRLMALTTRLVSNDADPVLDGFARADHVALTLDDGTRLRSAEVTRALGHADNPIEAGALARKFTDCLTQARRPTEAVHLLGLLARLETLADCRVLRMGFPAASEMLDLIPVSPERRPR
ncbi:MmgE/PrpD family protein [Roseomonas sp. HJA6]|uniref:MmgE/PrpD family protein n=1 Tax=Roseomonas alba TaxID=2846776 RepID=A0ABS7A9X2_9PROT|nr:MmgE/PrpD family protein [Neoroseomonas alba]MBW6399101.1 MmgE/PrpD family protein [Neoroseomonas alba]